MSDVLYIRISLKHLWRAVLQCATEIVKQFLGSHHGSRSKVYKSNVETFVDDYVLIFNVSVKDVLCPEIKDSGHQLGRDKTSSLINQKVHILEHIFLHTCILLVIHIPV